MPNLREQDRHGRQYRSGRRWSMSTNRRSQERTCVSCGRTFRTVTNYECPACRTTDRECIACGKAFRGTARRCRRCRETERPCAECGQTFRGIGSRCRPCQATERICTECGESFRDAKRKCSRCWYAAQRQRQCETCGCTFPGGKRHCSACLSTERECTECGQVFRGRYKKCKPCRALGYPERICTECGCTFCGNERRCWPCRATERICTGCGDVFHGHGKTCRPCLVAAQDPEVKSSRNRLNLNARRARKRGAEVCGPVPAAVYERLAAGWCVYCYGPGGTVDHVWPLVRGGPEAEPNLVSACGHCNSSKRQRLLTEWDPLRVLLALEVSPIVAAEYARLTAEAA